ncbi:MULTISPECIES: glycosyltransferase family 4 protein [unclassified Thioalkalivibrio]|uniref:glycosyltransferase family 4 protein n=1 Tax=unclassified Thioalkalivibrio TaxID=2621013 RepID=UPI00037B4AD8|nr:MULTISPECIES: glycosyltransferase family 4 protein [unclassified Thioalkalivibrio]
MSQASHYPFSTLNPYQRLMFAGLAVHGFSATGIDNGLRGLIAEARSGCAKVVHLHWIHGAVTFDKPWGALARLSVFHIAILIARLRGKRIVWTVHNLINHERKRGWLDRWNAKLVAREAHAILVHGESAIDVAVAQLGVNKEKIYVVHHGNYAGVVCPQPPRAPAEGVRFLFFGMIRPYKGVEDLLVAFRQTPGPHELHIAGKASSGELQQAIEDYAARDAERVTTELCFVPDGRLQELLGWSDVVVLPYRDIFTSGSLLMAMTAGRPVVAPRAGLIPEYIDGRAAFLYDPNEPNALEYAIAEAAQCSQLDDMARQAAERAKYFDWSLIGAKLSAIYSGRM